MYTNESKKRKRSPSYPAISLKEAIERAKFLYDADGQAGSSREAAFKHLGYTGEHGSSRTIVATLKKYGLTKDENSHIYLTKDAILILLVGGEENQRQAAIQRCALRPELYHMLWERYKKTGLPSNATLKTMLVNEFEFNKNKVDGAINAFRGTIEFAKLNEIADDEVKLVDAVDEIISSRTAYMSDSSSSMNIQKDINVPENSLLRDYSIPRKGGKVAVLRLEYPVSKADIEQIRKWLDLMSDAISEED